MLTSARPTSDELGTISLAIPDYVTLRVDGDRVLVTLRNAHDDAVSLATWAFALGTAQSYAGYQLGRAIAHLGGSLETMMRGLWDGESDGSTRYFERCSDSILASLRADILSGGELTVELVQLHTTDPEAWV